MLTHLPTFTFSGDEVTPERFLSATRQPISTYGSDNRYAALHAIRTVHGIELRCELVEAVGNAYGYVKIASEVVVDDEDALSVCCDMEYVAARLLRDLGIDPLHERDDFQTSLENFFLKEQHAVAAE